MLHIKYGFDCFRGEDFRGEDFEIVDGRTMDGRTPVHGHPISSPCKPNGSGELKISWLLAGFMKLIS